MAMPATDHFLPFRRVEAVEPTARGLRARVHGEQLRIDVVRADVVRLVVGHGGRVDERPTHAVCVDPQSLDVDVEVADHGDVWTVRTDALEVRLGVDPFRLDVVRSDGSPVLQTALDEHGDPSTYATLNDAFVLRRACHREDALYGLGERSGRHNRKGRDFTLWNTDVLNPTAAGEFTAAHAPGDPRADRTSTEFDPYYAGIPLLYHLRADGRVGASFIDNAHRAVYDLTADERIDIHFAGGQYTEYVFAGPALPDIVEAYTWLTGRASLPPVWSLGYQQCRWFRYTQDAVEALGRQHREHRIPCDALWLDIDHMDGYRVFTWNTDDFPDAPAMMDRLRRQGLRLVTIVDPGVKHDPGYRVYDDAVAKDVLCRTPGGDHYVGQVWPGRTVFPDFATSEAREWWGELNAAHVESGVAGIWNDMNEPATGDIAPQAMWFDHGREPHENYHNQYALLMAMATRSGLVSARPNDRPFILSRSGFAGIQRYAANWMGDNMARWDHLWLSMPMAMGFGLSGQPFVGADVGGFAGNTEPELFLRWMQYGALTPFFRNHSMIDNVDQYAWSFGRTIEDLVRDAVELRYRLLPYVYSAFVRATRTGEPVQRPLVFDHQHDATVRDIDDEYLFGRDLLVAPVCEPGVTARQVYLPDGEWFDWHTGDHAGSRQFVIAPTPLDRIPVYARGGAVVPTWPQAPATTSGYQPDTLRLDVFVPAADGEWASELTEDDGETTATEHGAHLHTTFTLTRHGERVTLRSSVGGYGFAGFRRRQLAVAVHGVASDRIVVNGDDVSTEDGVVTFANDGSAFELVIEDPR